MGAKSQAVIAMCDIMQGARPLGLISHESFEISIATIGLTISRPGLDGDIPRTVSAYF